MLTADDFTAFVAEVHSHGSPDGGRREPFPWQRALLDRILTEGRWPDVIDVPTGLGKTSVLDVSVFVSALRPDLARRRTFFVVDRRLVVDEAYTHAMRLRAVLRAAATDTCRAVAQALRADGDDEDEVLTVTRMRGGVTWDRIWLERPDRFAIVTGTVDQVGSRLLFRGYGVSEHARSIDAALVGTDSLIIVDEAHLTTAFTTTVKAALDLDSWPVAKKPTLVTMSATASGGSGAAGSDRSVHGISVADETHPIAGRRLRAAKQVRLVEVATTAKKAEAEVSRTLANLATGLTRHGVVGVVVNTVSRARAVFNLLDGVAEAILLTGRSRPIDREILLARYYPRVSVDRDRSHRQPLIVVATQTIEVGANIDLDALVTESAPLSALIQRLGRLNRLGLHHAPAPAYVVHDGSVTDKDPVYGAARLAAWEWLTTKARVGSPSAPDSGDSIDAAPTALQALRAAAPAAAIEPAPAYVPLLLTPTLDAWVRTSPTPHPDPPIAPFLHGLHQQDPPVMIVWRAGMPFDDLDRWQEVVDVVPPVTDEMIEVPLRAARQWLAGMADSGSVADIATEEAGADDDEPMAAPGHLQPGQRARDDQGNPLVLRYLRRGHAEVVPARHIRPGDTIIVPAEYGGCDQFGWHPHSLEPVVDVADLAERRGKPLLRIGPHLRQVATYVTGSHAGEDHEAGGQPAGAGIAAALDDLLSFAADAADEDKPNDYRHLLERLASALPDHNPLRRTITSLLATDLAVTPTSQVNARSGQIWTPHFAVVLSSGRSRQADDDTEAGSSASAYPGRRITLDAHQQAVAARAAEIARNLALPERTAASVVAAARWHDEGKRDIRFQAMLFAGRRAAAELATAPVAKSGIDPTNRAEARRAREAAGYPEGMRHEALSARIAAMRLADDEHLDIDLVLHLVASHHGRNRPLLPPIIDPRPVEVRVPGLPTISTGDTIDWQSPTRFATLNTRYGRWGLALLETVVRLADIWCSARDEEAA